MTPMERIGACFMDSPADRIPIFCNLIDQGAVELGISPAEYFSRGDLVAEAQLRMRERYGYDNVWGLFYVGKQAELFGNVKINFSLDGPPSIEEFPIKEFSDIRTLRFPENVLDHPSFQEVRRCIEILKLESAGRFPVCAYLSGTTTLPAVLMGMEKWMELLLCGPFDLRDELLEKCHQFVLREFAAYRALGVDLFLYTNVFASTDLLPMNLVQSLVLPWMKRDVSAVGTQGLVFYCGTFSMGAVLAQVIEATGIGVYYLSPRDDVKTALEIIAGRALTVGVINDMRLLDWTPDQVKDEVRRIIGIGKGQGKYGFGTVLMPLAIPGANIKALMAAAIEFGSFP